MNLKEFVIKTLGNKVDFDGYYGASCVDLFRQYNKDVFNSPRTESVDGAKDLFLNYENMPLEKQYYDKITSNFEIGDVIIWDKTNTNKYGHVAIILYVRDNDVIVLEQDMYTQKGTEIKVRSLNNVLGVLRHK